MTEETVGRLAERPSATWSTDERAVAQRLDTFLNLSGTQQTERDMRNWGDMKNALQEMMPEAGDSELELWTFSFQTRNRELHNYLMYEKLKRDNNQALIKNNDTKFELVIQERETDKIDKEATGNNPE